MLQNATIADHNLWWRDEEQMGAWSWSYFIFTFFSLIQLLLVLFLLLQQKTGEPVTSQTTGYIEYVRAGKKMGVGYEWLNNIADVHPGKQMTKHA